MDNMEHDRVSLNKSSSLQAAIIVQEGVDEKNDMDMVVDTRTTALVPAVDLLSGIANDEVILSRRVTPITIALEEGKEKELTCQQHMQPLGTDDS